MILPLIRTPSGELLNLAQMVAFHENRGVAKGLERLHPLGRPGTHTIEFVGNVFKEFTGDDADAVRRHVVFAANCYTEWQNGYVALKQQAESGIVTPGTNFNGGMVN